ncbi:hypothetical protein LEP1GSC125_1256, partial [Leptospira mayottensis 200901122]
METMFSFVRSKFFFFLACFPLRRSRIEKLKEERKEFF